jgi:high affinity Mn2+ porin
MPSLPFRPAWAATALLSVLFAAPLRAEDALFPALAEGQARLAEQGWLLRGQSTFILQGHPAFRSPYRAEGSLRPAAQGRYTVSLDLIVGRRLWEGAELIVDPQFSKGFGLSGTTGVAAFPNGEAFRIGSRALKGYVPRAFLRQTIALSAETVEAEDDPLRFPGPLPAQRLTFTAGKISVFDIFDDNRYAHDPRTQFMNWAFVGAGAYDFAADARGYTNGLAAEYDDGAWGLRLGAFQVARFRNGLSLDPVPVRGWQALAQLDRFWTAEGRPGAVRLLAGLQRARAQSWGELLANDIEATDANPTGGYRVKRMLVLNGEQEIADDLGAFFRLSWNDGRTQNWMFTEMDRAVSAGLSFGGARWGRPGDTLGVAGNVGWASAGRRAFLEAGGIGFITGDGRLNAAPEGAAELYYDLRVAPGVNLAADYQLIVNPAYNADRGPAHVFGFRARAAF